MKKKYILYILILSTGFGLASCKKNLLDPVPNDRLSAEIFWKTDADALLGINAVYPGLDGTSIFSWDAFSDIAHVNRNYVAETFVELGSYDISSTVVSDTWTGAYSAIQLANTFLANVDKVTTSNPTLIARYKAEARVLRAYQYIKLAGLFGDVPLVTKPLEISEASQIVRSPVSQIYDFIDTELAQAAEALPVSYTATGDIGRIRQGAAWALKARADLWAGRYQNAADAALKVTGYSLYSSYQNLFTYAAENNSEVILDKQFIKDTYSNNIFYLLGAYSQKGSQSTYVPTRSLVDMYEVNDPRKSFSIFLDGDLLASGAVFRPAPNSKTSDAVGNTYIASVTGYNIKKYINNSDYANVSNCGINIILCRYAEVLLTYAEAKVELNQIDQTVYNAINTVRNSRADVKLASITADKTQAQLREIVRKERTIELAFEGLHLFDIRRWKTAETVMQGSVTGLTYDNSGVQTTVVVPSSTRVFDKTKHYLWPIPQTERNLDANLSQNPGW